MIAPLKITICPKCKENTSRVVEEAGMDGPVSGDRIEGLCFELSVLLRLDYSQHLVACPSSGIAPVRF